MCIDRSKTYYSHPCSHELNLLSPVPGHPKFSKAAVFDIISPDLETGPVAAGGEIISVVNCCLDSFPNLSQNHEIHISHSKGQSL